MEKVNIKEKFSLFSDYWSPKIAGEINDMHVKFAKLKGEFIWHMHEHEDEMFLVVKGELLLKFRDRDVHLKEGEFMIVPKGVEHLPIAEEEAHVIFFEPKSTVNTGEELNERTVSDLPTIEIDEKARSVNRASSMINLQFLQVQNPSLSTHSGFHGQMC